MSEPIKRGRGRPRKIKPEVEKPIEEENLVDKEAE